MKELDYRYVSFSSIEYNYNEIRLIRITDMKNGSDWHVPFHKHHYFEFHYIFNGETYTKFKDKAHTLKKGDFYIMPPGLIHAHYQKNNSCHEGFSIAWEIKTSNLNNSLYKVMEYMNEKKRHDNGMIISEIKHLRDDVINKKNIEIIKLDVCRIFSMLHLFYGDKKDESTNRIDKKIIEQALIFMNENIANNLSAVDIANAIHISYTHLSRLFKKEINKSVKKTYRDMKIKKAKELLNFTEDSIDIIAKKSGFANTNYFYECFKRETDMTPDTFRNNHNADLLE